MSTLKVGTIQDHANGNNALVINSSGVVTTPARPAFRVVRSVDQAIADNTTTVIQLNTKSGNSELFDIGGYFNTSNYRYIPQVAGYYSITLGTLLESPNYQFATIRKNGANQFGNRAWSESGIFSTGQVTGVIHLNGSSDYIDATVYHNAGSSKNLRGLDGGIETTYMCGYLIG